MQKKLTLLVAGLMASLTLNLGFLRAADAPAATSAAPAAVTAAPATGSTPPATSAARAATSAAPAMTTGGRGGPTPDLTKLPKPSDKKDISFDKDIAPIFKASCLACHGATNPRQGLELTSVATITKGGKNPKDVVPGHADQSMIVLYTSGALPTAMPPARNRVATATPYAPALKPEEIGLIMAWINAGAK